MGLFKYILNGSVPLATLFFIIAIYKSVVSSPPEQALKKFLSDAMRYGIILFVMFKLSDIIEGIMLFSDRFAQSVIRAANISGKVRIEYGYGPVDSLMEKIHQLNMDLSTVDVMDFGATIQEFFKQMGPYILYFIGGVVTLLILVSSGLSVIGIAYQRIVKPLLMMPLSTVVLSMGCCSDEGTKQIWSMGKTFLGLCLSGGLFVLAVRMGGSVSSTLIADYLSGSGNTSMSGQIITIVGADANALIITALLKSMDAMIQKAFG